MSMDEFLSPSGPESLREPFRWPDHTAEALTESEGARLHRLLTHRLVFYSDYSGNDCYREALEVGILGLQRRFGWTGLPEPAMQFPRACDNAPLPQKVLKALRLQQDAGRSCLFGDIGSRLTEVPGAFLDAAKPHGNMPKEDRARAYKSMFDWLVEKRRWAYSGASFCEVHQRMCPSRPGRAAMLRPAHQELDGQRERPLFCNTSGMTCKGWSTAGSQLQFEDLFFAECTARFPTQQKIAEPLMRAHRVFWHCTGAEVVGWPHKRPCMFCVGLSRATLAWTGPENLDEFRRVFRERFGRVCQLTGVLSQYQELARVHGHFITTEALKSCRHQSFSRAF